MASTMSRAVATIAAVALLAAVVASSAAARPYAPPKGKIYAGVSDTGERRDYYSFARAVDRHVPVMQSFEPWGGSLRRAKQRWRRTRTRGMLSLSTSPCYLCEELISPRAIATGRGDGYLVRLNRSLANWGRPTYVRLLPEMNGHWNPYAAFNEDGSRRDAAHSTKQFRRAWRRVVLIVRGGRRGRINNKLWRLGLPKINRGRGNVPLRLKPTRTAFLWVPQTHGSPQIHANRPGAYWPGRRFVDWVGADIYGKFPNFAGLDRFYKARKKLPFMIGEWSPWDTDNPGFVNQIHEWVEARRRAKMLVYYQGFGENNPFMIQRYPSSARAMRSQLDNRRYVRFAPHTKRRAGKGKGGGNGGIGPKG